MSSTSEGTNAQNIANFNALINFLTSLGKVYQPSNPAIQLAALVSQQKKVLTAEKQFKDLHNTYSKTIDSQQLEFEDLGKLIVKIESAFKASGASGKSIETLQTITRKLKGARSKKIDTPPEGEITATKNISVSQQSRASRLSYFESLLRILSTEPLYNPNEAGLSLTALQAKFDALSNKYGNVTAIDAPVGLARINRNQSLYHPETGLINTVKLIKAYIKSIYGIRSPQFAQLSGIPFKNKKL